MHCMNILLIRATDHIGFALTQVLTASGRQMAVMARGYPSPLFPAKV
jgi:hypothetical protein